MHRTHEGYEELFDTWNWTLQTVGSRSSIQEVENQETLTDMVWSTVQSTVRLCRRQKAQRITFRQPANLRSI